MPSRPSRRSAPPPPAGAPRPARAPAAAPPPRGGRRARGSAAPSGPVDDLRRLAAPVELEAVDEAVEREDADLGQLELRQELERVLEVGERRGARADDRQLVP